MSEHNFVHDAASVAAQSAVGGMTAKTLGLTGIAGVAAGLLTMAITMPTNTKEAFRRLTVTVLTSIFCGPLVVDYFGLQNYSLSSQVGVCFIVGTPAWLVWAYAIHWLEKAQKKSPTQIANEIKRVKDKLKE